MLIDELVDRALVGRIDLFELQPHPHAAIAPRDAGIRFTSTFDPGSRKRTRTLACWSRGLIVRIATPPLLRFSVRAAAIVLPKR